MQQDITRNDFMDFYNASLERTCKTCKKFNYKKCNMFIVLQKYKIEPYKPDEKKHCPYSYAYDFASETNEWQKKKH